MAGPRLQMSPMMEKGSQERTGSECQDQDQGAETVLPTGGEKVQNPLPQWGLDLVCGVEGTTLCGKKKAESLVWKAARTEFKLQ